MTTVWPWQRSPIFWQVSGAGSSGGGAAYGHTGGGGGSDGGSAASEAAESARREAELRLAALMKQLAEQAAAGQSDPTQQQMATDLAKAAGKPAPIIPSQFTSAVQAPSAGQSSFSVGAPTTGSTGNEPTPVEQRQVEAKTQAAPDKPGPGIEGNPLLSPQGTLFGSTSLQPQTSLAPNAVPADALPQYLNPLTDSQNLRGLGPQTGAEQVEGRQADPNKQNIMDRMNKVAEDYRNAKPNEREALKQEYKDLQNAARAAEGRPTGTEQFKDQMAAKAVRDTADAAKYNKFLVAKGIDPYQIGMADINQFGQMDVPTVKQEYEAKNLAEQRSREWAHMQTQAMREMKAYHKTGDPKYSDRANAIRGEARKFMERYGGYNPDTPGMWSSDRASRQAIRDIRSSEPGNIVAQHAEARKAELRGEVGREKIARGEPLTEMEQQAVENPRTTREMQEAREQEKKEQGAKVLEPLKSLSREEAKKPELSKAESRELDRRVEDRLLRDLLVKKGKLPRQPEEPLSEPELRALEEQQLRTALGNRRMRNFLGFNQYGRV